MKLLALSHSLSDVDGVGRYGTEILRRVAPHCSQVRVLLARKHRGVSERVPPNVDVEVALPPDYFLYMGWPKFALEYVLRMPRIRAAAREADLVHCLSDYPHALLAVNAARAAGKPVIVSGHGTYSVAPFRYPGHRRLITSAYRRADAVLMGSAFALERLRAVCDLPNARVVHYGVDPEQFEGARALPRPAQAPRRYVLTIGELKERKGHHVSIPAFLSIAAKHPDVDLVIIGRTVAGDPYFEARRAEIRAAGLESRVHCVGLVSEAEKLAWLAHADVFLLTPVTSAEGGFEAFGLVFLEANICYVPTVGIKDSGAQDAIRDGETGFLAEKGDVAGVARALDRLLADPALRQRLGRAGAAFARSLDWDHAGAAILELYSAALRAPTKTTAR